MNLASLRRALLLAASLAVSGCATRSNADRGRFSHIRTVAVTYAPSALPDSAGSRVAGRIARHGAGFALGQLGFIGGILGLAVDVADVSLPSRPAKESSMAVRLLHASGTDALTLVARRTEREIARRRLFALSRSSPDAVIDLELRELTLNSADNRNLLCRATMSVSARLRSQSGATLWQSEATATSGRVRAWRDYEEQPHLARLDYDELATIVSRRLLEKLEPEQHGLH